MVSICANLCEHSVSRRKFVLRLKTHPQQYQTVISKLHPAGTSFFPEMAFPDVGSMYSGVVFTAYSQI